MRTHKLTSILLTAFIATTGFTVTACKKGGGSNKGKSDRLKWVNRPTTGTAEDNGKLLKMPGVDVWFYVPDVLYVYKNCVEATHSPEGPDKEWVPVIRCTSPDEVTSEDEDEETEARELTIYATPKNDMLISERSTASYKLQYEQAGYVVDSVNYFDEYLAKPGRRGIEIVAHTVDGSTGYPKREVRRFMFPKGDVVFIAHIDYEYGADRSGINSDWERIMWGFQFTEDGALYE
jgi:hypothetical protein